MSTSLLQLHNASACYQQRPVFSNLNLDVNYGERVALIGASGAGKSTLLNLLYQQHPQQIALVPQQLGLVNNLSVLHNIYIGGLSRHSTLQNLLTLLYPRAYIRHQITAIAHTLGIDETLDRPVATLSGGQKQRVAIARSLYCGHPIFVGDEPFSSLDERYTATALELLNQTFQTQLIVLHNIELALAFSSRVIALQHGKIVLDRPTRTLVTSDLEGIYP